MATATMRATGRSASGTSGLRPAMATTSAIGIAGSVSSLGSSRWSRSVASISTSATVYAPKITAGTGSGNVSVSAPRPSAPMTITTGVRQSIGRMLPSSCSGQRAPMRSATKPQMPPATARIRASGVRSSEANTRRSLRGAGLVVRSPDGHVARGLRSAEAPASASSTSVAWVTPVAPRGA